MVGRDKCFGRLIWQGDKVMEIKTKKDSQVKDETIH
jgi:hypothetical protein